MAGNFILWMFRILPRGWIPLSTNSIAIPAGGRSQVSNRSNLFLDQFSSECQIIGIERCQTGSMWKYKNSIQFLPIHPLYFHFQSCLSQFGPKYMQKGIINYPKPRYFGSYKEVEGVENKIEIWWTGSGPINFQRIRLWQFNHRCPALFSNWCNYFKKCCALPIFEMFDVCFFTSGTCIYNMHAPQLLLMQEAKNVVIRNNFKENW